MMIFTPYLLVGLGVWLAASAANMESFRGASVISILRGLLLGLLLWPIGLVVLAHVNNKEKV